MDKYGCTSPEFPWQVVPVGAMNSEIPSKQLESLMKLVIGALSHRNRRYIKTWKSSHSFLAVSYVRNPGTVFSQFNDSALYIR